MLGLIDLGDGSAGAPVTSYSNAYGSGDRTALFGAFEVSTATTWAAGTIRNTIDGDMTANSSHAVDWPVASQIVGSLGRWIFGGAAKYIDEITLRLSTAAPASTMYFKFYGSPYNPGAGGIAPGSVAISSQFRVDSGPNLVIPITMRPEGWYMIELYIQNVNPPNDVPPAGWWTEIEFKIADGAV